MDSHPRRRRPLAKASRTPRQIRVSERCWESIRSCSTRLQLEVSARFPRCLCRRSLPVLRTVAKHLSSLTLTQPAIPTLEQQHPQYEKDFARLSNPTSEADYAFWNANMREAERLIAKYGTGIGGGAPRGSGLAGSVASDLSSGR